MNEKRQNMKLKVCGMKYIDDIKAIGDLKPDYMGFRGALCEVRSLRNSSICTKNVNNLINIIKNQ